jgi:hypothetical protein
MTMTLRAASLEVLVATLSTVHGPSMLIETSNQGGDQRYAVMDPLPGNVVDELRFRDVSFASFATLAELDEKIEALRASFDDHDGTCFAARLTVFAKGEQKDVILLGQDLFCGFED